MKTKICLKCNKNITVCNYDRHFESCGKHNSTFTIPETWKIEDNKYKCQLCDKIFSRRGMVSHYYRVHTNAGKDFMQRHKPWLKVIQKNPHSWNHGLKKESNPILLKMSNSLKERYRTHPGTFRGKKHTSETKRKMRYSAISYIESNLLEDQKLSPRVGKLENSFFSKIQQFCIYNIQRGILLEGYYPDGYISEINIVIEFNEPFHYTSEYHLKHDKQKVEDFEKIGILSFIVKEEEWIKNSDMVILQFIDLLKNRSQS